jgi:hypothetical protein
VDGGCSSKALKSVGEALFDFKRRSPAEKPRVGDGIMDVTFAEHQDASDFEPKAEIPTAQEDVQTKFQR